MGLLGSIPCDLPWNLVRDGRVMSVGVGSTYTLLRHTYAESAMMEDCNMPAARNDYDDW